MIDLETMSIEPNACILSIGAVEFDIEEEKLLGEFYQNVTLSSCAKLGMHKSQSTLDWWAKDENKEARDSLTSMALDIEVAIPLFLKWSGDEIIPWANGASFDFPILKNAIQVCGHRAPWKYNHESDYRTFKRLYPTVLRPTLTGVKHNALADAKFQASHLMRILKSLNLAADLR